MRRQHGEDIDLAVQDDSHPEMTQYIRERRDFYNDAVIFNAATGTFDASYVDHYGDARIFRYVPYVFPHPLIQIESDLANRRG